MKRVILAALATLLAAGQASATTIALFEYGINVDGDLTPSGVNLAGFDTGTGLGTISITVGGAGAHSVLGFFDHEIDEAINTFFNELGSATGAPTAGQSWEIDEPGFVFGDIYGNFTAGTLDNTVGFAGPDDVSMAMGWNFSLLAGQTGLVSFFLSTTLPGTVPGFYLTHFDPDSNASLFFWSTLDIRGEQVPEPGSLLLLGTGLLGLAAARRRHWIARNTHRIEGSTLIS